MDFKVSDKLMKEQSFSVISNNICFQNSIFKLSRKKCIIMRMESLKIFRLARSRTLDLCDTGAAISAIELATQLGDGH